MSGVCGHRNGDLVCQVREGDDHPHGFLIRGRVHTTDPSDAEGGYQWTLLDGDDATTGAVLVRGPVLTAPASVLDRPPPDSEVERLRTWLREATECEWTEPCRLDHNGECQAHGYSPPCLIPTIRDYFGALT